MEAPKRTDCVSLVLLAWKTLLALRPSLEPGTVGALGKCAHVSSRYLGHFNQET